MLIKVFRDSREMTGYCKMSWLANIEYKINFFQTTKNNKKLAVYFVISGEPEEPLNDEDQELLELWKEKEPHKAHKALEEFRNVTVE